MRNVSGVFAVWLLMTSLACRIDPDAALRAELRDLQVSTAPGGARVVSESPVTRYGWGVTATWDVEVTTTWEQYVQHVRERLIGFSSKLDPSGSVEFTNTLPDDTHMVRIEPAGGGSPLRVRVSFSSLAR